MPKSIKKGYKRDKQRRNTTITAKQAEFARLLVSGKTQQDAYVEAYKPNTSHPGSIAQLAHRRAATGAVQREILRLRNRLDWSVLLTLNDRLKSLSPIILNPQSKPADVIQATSVYSRISGDQGPERHEHFGPGGAAIPIAASVTIEPPIIRRLSPRERLAQMKAARAARNAAGATPSPIG